MALPIDEQTKVINKFLGPYHRILPHRRTWKNIDKTVYIDNIPDILAGVLRQFSTRMLDIGRLGIDDRDRYMVYRSSVFDTLDTLQEQLRDWMEFMGVTDEMNHLSDDVRKALL